MNRARLVTVFSSGSPVPYYLPGIPIVFGATLSKSIAGFKHLGGEEVSIEKRLWQMSKENPDTKRYFEFKKVSTGVAKALLDFYPEINLLLVTGGLVRVDLPEGPLKILRF